MVGIGITNRHLPYLVLWCTGSDLPFGFVIQKQNSLISRWYPVQWVYLSSQPDSHLRKDLGEKFTYTIMVVHTWLKKTTRYTKNTKIKTWNTWSRLLRNNSINRMNLKSYKLPQWKVWVKLLLSYNKSRMSQKRQS